MREQRTMRVMRVSAPECRDGRTLLSETAVQNIEDARRNRAEMGGNKGFSLLAFPSSPQRITRSSGLSIAAVCYTFGTERPACGSGEIGRHTILRGWRRKAWGFKSPLPHQVCRPGRGSKKLRDHSHYL